MLAKLVMRSRQDVRIELGATVVRLCSRLLVLLVRLVLNFLFLLGFKGRSHLLNGLTLQKPYSFLLLFIHQFKLGKFILVGLLIRLLCFFEPLPQLLIF